MRNDASGRNRATVFNLYLASSGCKAHVRVERGEPSPWRSELSLAGSFTYWNIVSSNAFISAILTPHVCFMKDGEGGDRSLMCRLYNRVQQLAFCVAAQF